MIEYADDLNDFNLEILDVIEKYVQLCPDYELIHRLIAKAVSMSLCCAPNELVGVKTIMASIQTGITEYEQTHS